MPDVWATCCLRLRDLRRIAARQRCNRQQARSYRRARFYEERERRREELNGRMLACQILIAGLIARVANDQRDPLRILTDFRDEIKAVVSGINISGMENTERVRSLRARSMNCSR
jgi:hypothetical protein